MFGLMSRKKRYTKEFLQGEQFEIGDYTYGRPEVYGLNQGAVLRVGKYCSFAGDVKIFLGDNHRMDWLSTFPFPAFADDWPAVRGNRDYFYSKGDVVIGNDVWVGQEAFILSGVTIGHGAVLGARAVVTRNVDPYTIVAGNPAKVIRKRFPEATIATMLELAWWDWPVEVVRENVQVLCSGDLETLVELSRRLASSLSGVK